MSNVGKTYVAGVVVLDGQTFRGCTFKRDVVLEYHGSAVPNLVGNAFEGCRWQFAAAAARMLAFLQALNAQQGGGDVIASTFPFHFTIEEPQDAS